MIAGKGLSLSLDFLVIFGLIARVWALQAEVSIPGNEEPLILVFALMYLIYTQTAVSFGELDELRQVEKIRADTAELRADTAEREVARLAAKLRELGIEPWFNHSMKFRVGAMPYRFFYSEGTSE